MRKSRHSNKMIDMESMLLREMSFFVLRSFLPLAAVCPDTVQLFTLWRFIRGPFRQRGGYATSKSEPFLEVGGHLRNHIFHFMRGNREREREELHIIFISVSKMHLPTNECV